MSTQQAPRDPAEYRPSLHFKERFDEPERHLSGDVIEECIRHGDVDHQPAGKVYYRGTVAGVTYRLVASLTGDRILTGYPVGINTEVARASGRWSAADIEEIRQFIARDDE